MNPPFRFIFAALVAGSLGIVLSLQAASAKSEPRVARLDQLVALTVEQRIKATEVFEAERIQLDALAPADRAVQGPEARDRSRQQIRALLSPAQRTKFDLAPQTLGGGLRSNPDNIADRFDRVVGLSPEQKVLARQILWDEYANQLAAVPEGEDTKPFVLREATRDRLRTILTAEQLAKYNRTPLLEGGGAKMGGRLAPKGN